MVTPTNKKKLLYRVACQTCWVSGKGAGDVNTTSAADIKVVGAWWWWYHHIHHILFHREVNKQIKILIAMLLKKLSITH